MASILLTLAGSIAGNAILPGIGGAILGGVGAALGRGLDTALFGNSVVKGPRLDSLKVQDSSYGNGIPLIYGTVRVSGNVIWSSDLIETLSTESVGGKGMGGTEVQKASYAVDCAIALGFGPIGSIRTIWADSKEVYSGGKWKKGTLWDAEFYLGTSVQEPSPLMEGALGAGNVPAYRGIAYVVLHRLQLGNFGNRIPNFTFEVAAQEADPAPLWLGEVDPDIGARSNSIYDPLALPPFVVSRRGDTIIRVLIGGFSADGSGNYACTLVDYDLTGEVPLELGRVTSAFTDLGELSLTDIELCASPSGKKIVFAMQFGDPYPIAWVVYDVAAGSFGDLCIDMLSNHQGATQIAFLDEQRVIIRDTVDGVHGVRIYAVAGTLVTPIGFFDVWGAADRFGLEIAQFALIPGGLMYLAGDIINVPSALYGRGLLWQDNTLKVGEEVTVSTGMDTSTNARTALVPLTSGEYVLARTTSLHIQLTSFRLSFDQATVTRDWTEFAVSPVGMNTVNGRGDALFFIHQSFTSGAFRYGEIALTGDSFELVLDSTLIGGANTNTLQSYFIAWAIDATRFLLLNGGGADEMNKVALFEKAPSAQEVSVVAGDVLGRAGYEEEEFDLSGLAGLRVQGYTLPEPMAARAALSPLQSAFGFDLVESDAVLKARLLSATADAVLDTAETRAVAENGEPPPRSTTLRAQELDLPRELVVTHIDPALDYQKGSQRARRITSASHEVQNLSLPMVCSAQKAFEVAETHLFRQWAEREQINLTLSRAYVALDPGDVVSLEGKKMRLTSLQASGGLIKAEALSVQGAALSPSATSADGGQGLIRHGDDFVPTLLFLMDLPLLRSEDDQPGFYAAVSGRSGWRGAALLRAPDGVTFSVNATFTLPAGCGIAASVLAEAPTYYMDRANNLVVGMMRGNLSSCSLIELLNGANAALLGDEIIQFQTAVLNDDGSTTLSNLLRGRRGTENATAGHAVGERFVLLQNDTLRFLPLTLSDRGREYVFRAASTGQEVDEVPNADFTPTLETLAPLSPAHVAGARNDDGDVAISWKRRARKQAEWVNLIDVPLDEDSELYDVEILDGDTVVRSFPSLTSPAVSYTAANQTSDFGGAQSSVSVAVYQRSARYGRGHAAQASV